MQKQQSAAMQRLRQRLPPQSGGASLAPEQKTAAESAFVPEQTTVIHVLDSDHLHASAATVSGDRGGNSNKAEVPAGHAAL
jgi:hypothetical protein